MKKTSTLWLTKTAAGIALVLLAQLIGKMIPAIAVIVGPFSVNQLITGTLVNLILIVMTLTVGVGSGVTIGILSALLALLIGVGPIFPIITPFIAIGNALLAITYKLIVKIHKSITFYIAIILAAVIKCAFLWLTVPFVLKYISDIKPAQLKMLTIMFSWPQGITALCGGILALCILPLLKNAFSHK